MSILTKRLFVHVGPPKTGTSAIQYVLRQPGNEAILYPSVGRWADGSHHNLVFNFFGEHARPEVQRAEIGEMFRAIAEEAAQAPQDILLSSEALWGRDVAAFVAALHHAPGIAGRQLEILVGCREHYGRAASVYNQQVKDGFSRERRTPDAFLIGEARRLTYAPALARLRESGLAVRVMNYHPANTFVARFLKQVGVPVDAEFKAEARNVSLSVKGLVATLAANHAASSAEHRALCFAAIRRMRPLFSPSTMLFSPDAVAAVEDVFARDRDVLNRDYGISLPPAPVATEAAFAITTDELAQIVGVTADLSDLGAAIAAFARRHLRV